MYPSTVMKGFTPCSQISNYFTKQKQTSPANSPQTNSSSSTSKSSMISLDPTEIDSPYRNFTNIKPISLNDTLGDEDDFTTKPKPKMIKLVPPKTPKKKRKSPKKKNKPKSQQNTVLKLTKDNFSNEHSDVNADHLQLALALSRSECETPKWEENLDSIHLPSTSKTVEVTLDRFGFRSNKPRLEPNLKKTLASNNAGNRRKKSPYTYVKPILFIRTEKDRESLISSKISLILSKSHIPPLNTEFDISLNSQRLQRYHCKENRIFDTNFIYEKNEFYVENLKIPSELSACGCLLRSWENIAGREKSPERSKENTPKVAILQEENNVEKNSPKENTPEVLILQEESNFEEISVSSEDGEQSNKNRNTCISPDMFESDSENEASSEKNKTPEIRTNNFETPTNSDDEILSQSLLSPKRTPKKSTPKKISVINNVSSQISTCLDFEPIAIDLTNSDEENCSVIEENNLNITFNNRTAALNITDYINEMLTQDANNTISEKENCKDNSLSTSEHMDELHLSTSENSSEKIAGSSKVPTNSCKDMFEDKLLSQESKMSQESVVISDEELNYSTKMHNQSLSRKTRGYYDLEEFEDAEINEDCLKEPEYNIEDIINLESTPILPFRGISEIKSQQTPAKKSLTQSFLNDSFERCIQSHPGCLKQTEIETKNDNTTFFEGIERISKDDETSLKFDIIVTKENCKNNSLSPIEHMDELHLSTSENSSEKIAGSSKVPINSCKDIFEKNSPEKSENSSKSFEGKSLSQELEISQKSAVISDEELNYSTMMHNQSLSRKTRGCYDLEEFGHIEINEDCLKEPEHNIVEDIVYLESTPVLPHKKIPEIKSQYTSAKKSLTQSFVNDSLEKFIQNHPGSLTQIETETKIDNAKFYEDIGIISETTPVKFNDMFTNKIPNENLLVKTKNVTPMPNYDQMSTPTIGKELQKFGLKSLKRKKGVKLLKYLYECTHPVVESSQQSSNDEKVVVKKRRKERNRVREIRAIEVGNDGEKCVNKREEVPVDVFQSENDLIFESRQSVRIASCRIPLHIVWHNFLACNKEIAENVLLYEPIQLEVIHSMLKEQGFKFKIQDLQTFLDKKCITIRAGNGGSSR